MHRRSLEGRAPPPQPLIKGFQPLTEWVQDPFNYILLVHLPGFSREDLRVITDKSGKITVRGRKQVGDGRIAAFEQCYDVPKDSKLDMIKGKFEDGCLALTIPKITTVVTEKADGSSEEKKEESFLKEKQKMTDQELRKDEAAFEEMKAKPISKEKPTMDEEQRKEEAAFKEKKEEPTSKEIPKIAEAQMKGAALNEMKDEAISKGTQKMAEKRWKQEAAQKEMTEELTSKKKEIKEVPTLKEKKESMHKEIADSIDENKKEEPTQKKPYSSSSMNEKKGEAIREDKLEACEDKKNDSKKLRQCTEVVEEKPMEKGSRKRRWNWNEEDKGWLYWLDSGLIDYVLEKVNRNRKFIVVALVAFSTGFYISHKLRTRG